MATTTSSSSDSSECRQSVTNVLHPTDADSGASEVVVTVAAPPSPLPPTQRTSSSTALSDTRSRSSSNSSNHHHHHQHSNKKRAGPQQSSMSFAQQQQQPIIATSHHRNSMQRRPSDESVHSNYSTATASSVFSTASKLSKLPHAVKSSLASVKDFVIKSSASRRRSVVSGGVIHPPATASTLSPGSPTSFTATGRNSPSQGAQTIHHYPATTTERDSLTSRFRRRAPSAMSLSSRFSSKDHDRSLASDNGITASVSTTPDFYIISDQQQQHENRPKQHRKTHDKRSSMLDMAARILHVKDDRRRRAIAQDQNEHLDHDQPVVVNDFSSIIDQDIPPDGRGVGTLLFGVDIEHSGDFFDQDISKSGASSIISDAKSDHVTAASSAKEVIWDQHKRAKSYQETSRIPSLRQLAKGQYPSVVALDSAPIPPPIPSSFILKASTMSPQDIPFVVAHKSPTASGDNNSGTKNISNTAASYHTMLVSATLTTLHLKLSDDCDQLLAATLIPPSSNQSLSPVPSEPRRMYPEDDLRSILQDLRRMAEMVTWASDDGANTGPAHSEKSVRAFLSDLDDKIKQGPASAASIAAAAPSIKKASSSKQHYRNSNSHNANLQDDQEHQAMVNTVKDIISSMKYMNDQCIAQYYKVAKHALVIPCKGFWLEGKNCFGSGPEDYAITEDKEDEPIHIEHMDEDAYWYRKYFVDQQYATFLGYREKDEPLLFSALCDFSQKQYRVIVREKQGPDIRRVISDPLLLRVQPIKGQAMDTTWKAVAEGMLDLPFQQLKKIDAETMVSSGLENELLMLDEQAVHKRHKFGVVYMKEGQTREEEWLGNVHDSESFDRFLNIIGHKVELSGYMGWTGGLDTKIGDSGEYAYVGGWNDHEIAYHVSSLIPSKPGDKQQIQKKRHIGNDMVCIVYATGKQPFNPAAIKSQFLHIFVVVHEDEWEGRTGWRIEVVAADNVPCFNPSLSENAIFFDENKLRRFLLAKLISAEYAAYKSPKFAQPMARAREGILFRIVDRGYKIAKDPDIPHLHHHGYHSSFFSTKSPSTSSDRSSKSTRSISSSELPPMPTPSRSSILRELSEGIVSGISRRRNHTQQHLAQQAAATSSESTPPKPLSNETSSRTRTARAVKLRKGKATRLSNVPQQQQQQQQQRTRSAEQDLMHLPAAMSISQSSNAIAQSAAAATVNKSDRPGIRNRFLSTIGANGGGGTRRQQKALSTSQRSLVLSPP